MKVNKAKKTEVRFMAAFYKNVGKMTQTTKAGNSPCNIFPKGARKMALKYANMY